MPAPPSPPSARVPAQPAGPPERRESGAHRAARRDQAVREPVRRDPHRPAGGHPERRAGPVLRGGRPTGCGKSTMVGLVSGLDRPTAGEVLVGGTRCTASPPAPASSSRPTRCCPGGASSTTSPSGRGSGAPQGRCHSAGPRLAPPGRAGRLRAALPASAVGRHAQARQPRGRADQRPADPHHGRAVRRPRRADEGDHVERAARPVGADPADGAVHHPRPRGGGEPRRPGRRDDLRPGHDQGRLRHRPAAAAGPRAGDPLRSAVHRAAPAHLGLPAGRGRARLRPDHPGDRGRGVAK